MKNKMKQVPVKTMFAFLKDAKKYAKEIELDDEERRVAEEYVVAVTCMMFELGTGGFMKIPKGDKKEKFFKKMFSGMESYSCSTSNEIK